MMLKACIFPGQGSQYKGMGAGLFEEFPEIINKADEILGYSIRELCLFDRENTLSSTQYTQPALYTVNALMYLKKTDGGGEKPDYVAGHSLGEYDALFAAGVFDFATGLKLVKKRGELMGKARGGGMAAVIGLKTEDVAKILAGGQLGIEIANINTPVQTVVSGPSENIRAASGVFEKAGASRYVVLNTSGAFHSRYMEPAKREFEIYLEKFSFHDPQIPVLSNYTARPYKAGAVKSNLAKQITGTVKWVDSIRFLQGRGEISIEQVGPGHVLDPMTKAIRLNTLPDYSEEVPDVCTPAIDVPAVRVVAVTDKKLSAITLGSDGFKKRYGLKYAYLTGGMYRGISSKELVASVGKAGMMGFLGSGGLSLDRLSSDIKWIKSELGNQYAFGVNYLSNAADPRQEEAFVALCLNEGVKNVEAAAFVTVTPSIVWYKLSGLRRSPDGVPVPGNRIIAKLSRPEVARMFLSPAPKEIVDELLASGKITGEQAELSRSVPIADDITVEADSGGHTDGGVAYALMPVMTGLRDEYMKKYGYREKIHIGAAGGVGAPEAVAASFMLSADYIVTGSINQCTAEAATSDPVKDMLQSAGVQDTAYAPAGDMFEIGGRVQVLKKGLLFPQRANKLYELYKQYNALDEIDTGMQNQLKSRFFKRTFEEILDEIGKRHPGEDLGFDDPKHKMALVFKWYLSKATRSALEGNLSDKVNFQIQCGPAIGAFNRFAASTEFADWRHRHAGSMGVELLKGAADTLTKWFSS